MSPVLPKDFKTTLPEDGDGYCELFRKYIKMSVLLYRWHKYKYTSDGHFTKEFEAELCAACAGQKP